MLLIGERTLQKPQGNHRSNRHRNSPGVHQIHELAREQNHQTHSRKTQRGKQNILQERKGHHTVQATQSTEEHRHQRCHQNESRADAHRRLILRSHRHHSGVDVHARHQKHRSDQRRNQTVPNQLRKHTVTTQRMLSAHRTNQTGVRTEGHQRNRNREQRHQTEELARTLSTNTVRHHHRGHKRDTGTVHHAQRSKGTALGEAGLLTLRRSLLYWCIDWRIDRCILSGAAISLCLRIGRLSSSRGNPTGTGQMSTRHSSARICRICSFRIRYQRLRERLLRGEALSRRHNRQRRGRRKTTRADVIHRRSELISRRLSLFHYRLDVLAALTQTRTAARMTTRRIRILER